MEANYFGLVNRLALIFFIINIFAILKPLSNISCYLQYIDLKLKRILNFYLF